MKNRQIPKGLRDFLPNEVKNRRKLEQKAIEVFTAFGYKEVLTPTFEFLEVVETGAGKNREKLFLFMDREGGILSLRPEMTVSIARLAAMHLKDSSFPQRFFYSANVFRHVQPHLAQYREFWQIGIEMLGASGPWADAEVINLAVKILKAMGLDNFKISINQIGIFNSLLADCPVSPDEKDNIRNLVEIKDLVELSRCLDTLPVPDLLKETIARLPILHGGLEVLNRIPYVEKNKAANEAVEELLRVYEALQAFGVEEHIVVDMGVLRDLEMDYYTGIIFEGYSPELGYGLLGGGRYDNLLGQFGFPCPATGFALGMDRLALVLTNQEQEPPHYILGGKNLQVLAARADQLRHEGKIVELDVEAASREVLEEKIRDRDDLIMIYLDDE
ncbi:Histidine-tRNA ligase/ATP phosphoribosyltransferase regulatory subunit [Syntrophomonas zehnderi OL-4]|uniref:ATP phosphoribosyltransferase regulatory subunit n=1 Tax=Syntrophomonas zehnderi OL-4 TaxID=690567 RepID=A0A0E4GCQ6_9FIRM|nr:ATP phosphoribosyltransferase regulatory subunit [Syntrophomonas zehnderi]CFY03574.1 Histidine-tRNA ligase/ATP phosphoribosyltransferase regulatory subunit [Syntrophomonas zehnderi OL-4]